MLGQHLRGGGGGGGKEAAGRRLADAFNSGVEDAFLVEGPVDRGCDVLDGVRAEDDLRWCSLKHRCSIVGAGCLLPLGFIALFLVTVVH